MHRRAQGGKNAARAHPTSPSALGRGVPGAWCRSFHAVAPHCRLGSAVNAPPPLIAPPLKCSALDRSALVPSTARPSSPLGCSCAYDRVHGVSA